MTKAARSPLGTLMERLAQVARQGDAALTHEPMSGTTRQVDGLRSEADFAGLKLVVDEPVEFGGTGTAPNPAEVMMAALGASIEVTLRCYAEWLTIDVGEISVDLAGALDNRGFFGADPSVRSGFPSISAAVRVTGTASRDELDALLAHVERACPVLETLRNGTHIDLQLLRR